MTSVVLDCRHTPDGYYVRVLDDRDAFELYRTRETYATIAEACHAACDELHPYEHVADILDPMEDP